DCRGDIVETLEMSPHANAPFLLRRLDRPGRQDLPIPAGVRRCVKSLDGRLDAEAGHAQARVRKTRGELLQGPRTPGPRDLGRRRVFDAAAQRQTASLGQITADEILKEI